MSRAPPEYLEKAATILIQQIERFPALAKDPRWLWQQMTAQSYSDVLAVEDMASVPAIYNTILRSCRLMVAKETQFLQKEWYNISTKGVCRAK